MNYENCLFCRMAQSLKREESIGRDLLFETEYFYAIKDGYPVTQGHSLIISKNHKVDYFELSDNERRDLERCTLKLKSFLDNEYKGLTGYNIGMNCGASAGQTIIHFHQHLIPRRDNDCEFPRGGVRGVIPGRMSY